MSLIDYVDVDQELCYDLFMTHNYFLAPVFSLHLNCDASDIFGSTRICLYGELMDLGAYALVLARVICYISTFLRGTQFCHEINKC
jgi:hypothetical protein